MIRGAPLVALVLLVARAALAQEAAHPSAPWLPRRVAVIEALDKVYAQAATLRVGVGQSAAFEAITITVKACQVSAADPAMDAAAELTVTQTKDGAALFSGWMLSEAPSSSMMEDPVYDLRVAGCE